MRKATLVKGAVSAVASLAMIFPLAACGGTSSDTASTGGKTTIKVAAFLGGYGEDIWKDVVKSFEADNKDISVDLTVSRTIDEEITPSMKAGDYPDVVQFTQGQKSALTETMLKDKAVEDVTDILSMTVPGESKTVKEKLVDGIIGLNTNPYGTDKTYLMPLFYAPTGLVYNQTLMEQNGWEVPKTWDEMFKLGVEAKAKGISLFTYPTSGYFDGVFNSVLADAGGTDFYKNVMMYKKDIWKSSEAKTALDRITKLVSKDYLNSETVGYANNQDFTKNQQQILDGKSLFMPNGTWIVNEMKDAPRTDGFKWGVAPLPAIKGDTRYVSTQLENIWIPSKAKNKEAAKKFISYLYTDKAAKIFASAGAIQPIRGGIDGLDENLKIFYDMYSLGDVKPITGNFSATASVEGVNIKSILYESVDSIASGTKTEAQWLTELNDANNKLNAAISK